jgi:hypothetical protein
LLINIFVFLNYLRALPIIHHCQFLIVVPLRLAAEGVSTEDAR